MLFIHVFFLPFIKNRMLQSQVDGQLSPLMPTDQHHTYIEQHTVKAAFYTRHAVCKTSQASSSFASSMHFRHVFFFLLIPNICPVARRQRKKKKKAQEILAKWL